MNYPITEAEREEHEKDLSRNYHSPADTVYFLNESMKKLGIPTETQAKTPQVAAEKQKTIEEILSEKGQPLNRHDLTRLLNRFYTDGQSDDQIANLESVQIYKLVMEDKRKIVDAEHVVKAAKYFEGKGTHESALQLAKKIEDKEPVRNIYESEYNLLVKDGKYADAIKVAKEGGLPREKVDSCIEKAKNDYGKDKVKMGKVLLARML